MWTATGPTLGLSSRRQWALKTRSGQRNGPKIGSTFQNNFFLTIRTNHGKICGFLCCNGRYQLLREILYYQYIFVKYCGEFHCFISSSGFDVQDRTNPSSKCSCNIAIIVIIGPKRVKLRQNTRFATICVNSKWHFVFCASKLWEQNYFFIFTKKDDF